MINATKTKRISSKTSVKDKNRSKIEENSKKQHLRTVERETRVHMHLAKNQMYRSECKLHEKERKKKKDRRKEEEDETLDGRWRGGWSDINRARRKEESRGREKGGGEACVQNGGNVTELT